MIIAYILTNVGMLRVRPIFDKSAVNFNFDGVEYKIDRKYIYQKKFLGFKTFFFMFYIQGIQDPLAFSKEGLYLPKLTHINEIAILMKKLKLTLWDNLAKIGLVLCGFGLMLLLWMVYEIGVSVGAL